MPSPIVVDASLMAAFLLREPDGKKFDTILGLVIAGERTLHAPALFEFEMLNILIMAERRKRLTSKQAETYMHEWATIPIIIDTAAMVSTKANLIALGRRHQLTAYDASYLELAIRLNGQLASLDSDILRLKKSYGWIL